MLPRRSNRFEDASNRCIEKREQQI